LLQAMAVSSTARAAKRILGGGFTEVRV